MRRALVTVAPTAGAGVREALRAALGASGLAHALFELRAGEEISAAVRARLPEGWACVAAVGGDGTVSAVAHALVGTGLPLGIVPAGTGNLVARELGIPLDPAAAVALLAGPHVARRIDAMRIGGRTYLLNAGVGINAEVIDRTSRLGKSLFGRSAYVGTAVWEVLQARPQPIEIAIDGGAARTFEATDVAISNCGILAQALNPYGPAIRVDDGRVNVCVLCMKTPLEYPWYYVLRRFAPRHVNRIMHEFEARSRVSIRTPAPVALQADGDIIGATPVEIEVLPLALEVLVPPARAG